MTKEEETIILLRLEIKELKAEYQSLADSFYLSITKDRTPERATDIINEAKAQKTFNTSFDNLTEDKQTEIKNQ